MNYYPRLSLARCVLQDPLVILNDLPHNGLDGLSNRPGPGLAQGVTPGAVRLYARRIVRRDIPISLAICRIDWPSLKCRDLISRIRSTSVTPIPPLSLVDSATPPTIAGKSPDVDPFYWPRWSTFRLPNPFPQSARPRAGF